MSRNPTRRHLRLAFSTLLAVCAAIGNTGAQVTMVKDINPGPGGTYVLRAGAMGSAIYFSAYDGVHGEELWISNGTAAGTYLVADIWPTSTPDNTFAYSSKPEQFVALSPLMYFVAGHREDPLRPPNHEINLWLSNGQPGNASMVENYKLALDKSLQDSALMDGSLMIAGWDEIDGVELWKVAGGSGTRITDIEPLDGGSFPSGLTVVGSLLFFSAVNSATFGSELWVTDGTYGAEWVIDIVPGTQGSTPRELTAFGGEAYFIASTVDEGDELWASNGTVGGTRMVADIAPGHGVSSSPMNLVPVGAQLFFTAYDETHDRELWVTDGSGAGTRLVKDIVEGGSLWLWEAVPYNGRLFFVTEHPDSGRELWVSDGTEEGTLLFVDINPGTHDVGEETIQNSSEPSELTVAGSYLFFNADDGVHGPSLWVSDGTQTGTFMVANLFDYSTEEGPKGLTATTDRLFFQTESEESGMYGREVHSLPTANVVKPPAAPTGETSGSTETAYTYSTAGGSVSLDGEPVQYRFHWGDGTPTGWLEEGVTSAEHTWTEAGTYDVTVEARSTVMTSITSNHSAPLPVLISFTETVDVSFTYAPETGQIWIDYDFVVSGSSDYGHDLQYSVNWGDGSDPTAWAAFNAASGETLTHSWDSLGEKEITVTLRCADDTDVTDFVQHWITIEEETIGTPTIDGPTTGWIDEEYTFTISGESSAGHDLHYRVFWGDGGENGDTGWQPFGEGQTSAEVSHTWTVAEPFGIEVGVRCATHDHLEGWNSDHSIEITAPPDEELTGPGLQHVGGDWNGYPDVSYSFTLSASSNLDHGLEYRVDWAGDMVFSEWTAFGEGATSLQLSHTWDAAADWDINIEVRCIDHPEEWASGTWRMFINPEVVGEISLEGPSSGAAGVSAAYVLTGRSASGHAMQYYMDWGHSGAQTGWLDINPATGTVDLSHAWPSDGTYHLQYGVRCATHDGVEAWSETWVTILGETMATHTLEGPAEGLVGVDLEFTVTATSSEDHDLQYRFDWGDGFPTDWATLDNGTDTAVASYHWAYADEFTVTASVRCAAHNHVLSEKAMVVTITSDTPPGWIFGDDFEYGDTEDWSAAVGLVP